VSAAKPKVIPSIVNEQMINLDRVAEVITESHEEGHLSSQLAVSTLQYVQKTKTNQNHRELQQEMGKESQSVSHKTYPEEEREESRVEGNRDNAGQHREEIVQQFVLQPLQQFQQPT